MDENVVPRTRNLRPRKPYVDPFAQPRRSVRRARARLSAADFYVLDNDDDGDWNGVADDEAADDDVVELGSSQRRPHRSHRRITGRREASRSARSTPEPAPRKRTRKPKVLLPEDVPFREPVQPQPEADPEDAAHAPSVAFIAIFIATFPSLFEDLGRLPSPQDLEAGLLSQEPSELVEFVFRRILGCVLNRKKEIEVGRYGSALSELHAQRNTLGMGPYFPPLQWKSKGNAFAELQWYDRLELLHVLVHWSLSASDRVRQLLRQLDDEAVNPWIGADEAGNHYYIVGFDPVSEGAEEHTPFRVYKESNRLLQTVKWEPVASSAAEVQAFLDSHIKQPAKTEGSEVGNKAAKTDAGTENANAQKNATTEDTGANDSSPENVNLEPPSTKEGLNLEQSEVVEPSTIAEEAVNEPAEPEPVEYDLPQTVVDTLLYFLPAMYRSEAVTMDRLQKEAKRARRRNDIMWQAEHISNGGGRYAGRTRGRKINYAELLRDTVDDDEDEQPRKRRLRQRDSNYEWKEPEPETRQQRHARIMAERAAERAAWSSNDVSVEPTPDYAPSTLSNEAEVLPSNAEEVTGSREQLSQIPGSQNDASRNGAQLSVEQQGHAPVSTQANVGASDQTGVPAGSAGATPVLSTNSETPRHQSTGAQAPTYEASEPPAPAAQSLPREEAAVPALQAEPLQATPGFETATGEAPAVQSSTQENSKVVPSSVSPHSHEPTSTTHTWATTSSSGGQMFPQLAGQQQQPSQGLEPVEALGMPVSQPPSGSAGQDTSLYANAPVVSEFPKRDQMPESAAYATATGENPGVLQAPVTDEAPSAHQLGSPNAQSDVSGNSALQPRAATSNE